MKAKIIVIVGPTSSRKSTIAMEIAKKVNGEIISADAFQVYKELNIGVNKPSKADMEAVPHHLISAISVTEPWDIKIFQKIGETLIKDIIKRKRVPIICGGSHLYIDALIKGYDLDKAGSRALESKQSELIQAWKIEELYQFVWYKDPVEAEKIGPKNYKRLLRAAQIITATGKPKSELDNHNNSYVYDPFIIYVNRDRALLYEKINSRVDEMVANGWAKEVKDLVKKHENFADLNAAKAIGYRDIYEGMINKTTISKDAIKRKTRLLAKRQMTWCRNRYARRLEYDYDKDNISELMDYIKKFYGKRA